MSASVEKLENSASLVSEESIKKVDNKETKTLDEVDRVVVEDKAIPVVQNGVDVSVEKVDSDAVNSDNGVKEMVNGSQPSVRQASDTKSTSETSDTKSASEKSDLDEKSPPPPTAPSIVDTAEKAAEKSDVSEESLVSDTHAIKSDVEEKLAENVPDAAAELAKKSAAVVEEKSAANVPDAAAESAEKSAAVVEEKPVANVPDAAAESAEKSAVDVEGKLVTKISDAAVESVANVEEKPVAIVSNTAAESVEKLVADVDEKPTAVKVSDAAAESTENSAVEVEKTPAAGKVSDVAEKPLEKTTREVEAKPVPAAAVAAMELLDAEKMDVKEKPSEVATVVVTEAEKMDEKSEIAEKPVSNGVMEAKNSAEKPEIESVASKGDETSVAASDADKRKGEMNDIFTDAMVEKIERNYSNAADEEAVNLLETPDEEMFGDAETKPAAATAAAPVITNGDAAVIDDHDAKPKEGEEKETTNSDANEAVNLLLQGKRNMLMKDYESAVSTLGDACQKFASVYGDLGAECAEVYMAYGHALLELWRVEEANKKNGEEADEIKGADDATPEDAAEAKENGVAEDANEEKDAAAAATIADEAMDVDESVEKNGDETENQDGGAVDESNVDEENPTENNDEEEEVESEEEVDNLQVAWEILELAKKIYEKTNDDANLAKVHSKLGEISIASGNHAYAVDDLKRSLELLARTPAAVDVRHKANIHFQLYIAHTMKCSFPEAEAELRVAKSTFETHLRDLETKLAAADESSGEAISAEIKEIKEVILDLSSKMVESHKEKRELITAISDVIKTKHPLSEGSASASASTLSTTTTTSDEAALAPSSAADAPHKFSPLKSDVPVHNISHLVRKKPKVVGEEAKPEEKKPEKATNDLSNGTNNSEAAPNEENGVESSESAAKESVVAVVNAADANQESATKRKADDDLEKNDVKKFCA